MELVFKFMLVSRVDVISIHKINACKKSIKYQTSI